MKVRNYLFLLIFSTWLLAPLSHAEEHVLAGALDSKHAVHMFLEITGGKAEAQYFYDRIGTPIYLSGSAAGGKIQLENAGERFSGGFDGKYYTGIWTDKRRKHDLQFALQPADTQMKDITGRYKCEASRSGAGGSVSVPVALEMKAGNVTRFSIESLVTPYAHSCNPDHGKFRQTLKGRALMIESLSDADQRCPMSLRRAGPFILLKNEGGACLCGARASIPDVLLDTRNSSCRIAQ